MNLLIIGGLLAFALMAILGAVLLGMGEQRSEKAHAAEAPAPVTPLILPVSPVPPVPVAPVVTQASGVLPDEQPAHPSQSLRRTVPLSQELTLHTEKSEQQPLQATQTVEAVQADHNEYPLPALNGQVHVLAAELHSLQQHTWELEQRLQGLVEMLDHLQAVPSRHLDAAEERSERFPTDAI